MKTVMSKLKKNRLRFLAVFLCLSLLTGLLGLGAVSLNDERTNRLNEWMAEVYWDNEDPFHYSLTSAQEETLRPKLVVKYYASQALRAYAPGEVRFTISGLDDVQRSGRVVASTTVDSSDSKWELLESAVPGEYIFANKVAIPKDETLSGGFEMMWEFESREGTNGYSKTIAPVFSVKNDGGTFDSITLPDITFQYHSERDYYYLTIETYNIDADEYEMVMGIGQDGLPTQYERYSWHRQRVKFNPHFRGRGARLSDFFVFVKIVDTFDPETGTEIPTSAYQDVQVLRNDGTRTTLQAYSLYDITHLESDRGKTVYGFYEFVGEEDDLTNDEYLFYIGYPYKDETGNVIGTFDEKYVFIKGYLDILYYDETEYVRLNNETMENENIVASALKKNEYYNFSYHGGEYTHYHYNDRYEIVAQDNKVAGHTAPPNVDKLIASEVYKDKIVYFDVEMLSRRTYTSSGAAAQTIVSRTTSTGPDADPGPGRDEGVFMLQGIDRFSVELEDGSLRRLYPDEYDIASILVPKDEYRRNYKVYVTDTPDIPYENYTYYGQGNTASEKSFALPRGAYCGFYVEMEDVKGTYTQISTVGVRFHLRSSGMPMAIDPNGKLISFSFFRVHYTDQVSGEKRLLTNVLLEDYKGEYTRTIAADDMASQGEYVYRRFSNVFLREPIVHMVSTTETTELEEEGEDYIRVIDDLYGGGYTFPVKTGGEIFADVYGGLEQFSIHTLLPEELVPNEDLSEIQYNAAGFLEGIKVEGEVHNMNGEVLTGVSLEDYVRFTVTKRSDGKTVVSAYFDFSECPLNIRVLNMVSITFPVRVSRMDYGAGTKDFTVTSYTAIQDEITSQVRGPYIQYDADDIDGCASSVWVATSSSIIEGEQLIHQWENNIHKNVKTYFSGGYTTAQIKPALGIDNRVFTFAREDASDAPQEKTTYSYQLSLEIEEPIRNIVMYDNIEPVDNAYVNGAGETIRTQSRWQGDLINVDTSFLKTQSHIDYTVYYSTSETEALSGVTSGGVVSGNWRAMTPHNGKAYWTVPASETGKARSIAVAIDTRGVAISENILFVTLNMHAPEYPSPAPVGDFLAQNAYKLTYDTESAVIPAFMISTVTNVELYENQPMVTFLKVDADSGRALKGASFELYQDDDGNGEGEPGELVDSGVSNNLGKWTTYKMKHGKTYLLYEVGTPAGYQAFENPKTVVLDPSNESGEYSFEVQNTRVLGTVHITKTDYDGFITGNLKGAGFELYRSDGSPVYLVDNGDNTYSYQEDAVDLTSIFYTGADGLSLLDLPWGNYYILEVEAPKGFEINGAAKKFSITSQSVTVNIEKTDIEKTASLQLKKFSETGEVLPSAWYQLQQWNKTTSTWDVIADFLSTDAQGLIRVDDLKFGYYRFVEINAPVGYDMNPDAVAKSPIADEIKVFGLEEGETLNVLNYVDRTTGMIALNERTAGLTLQVNDVNNRQSGEATLRKLSGDGTPLNGAKFDLYMVVEGSAEGRLVKSGLTTDANGRITPETGDLLESGLYGAADLEWGRYYFKETYAPAGYRIAEEPFYFDVNGESLEIDITIENERKPGSILLTKYASEATTVGGTVYQAGDVLAGAKFSLYLKDGTLVPVKAVSAGSYTISATASENTVTLLETNGSGQISVSNLPWGVYYLEEKQAPAGFQIADKVRFTINSRTCSSVQRLECYDDPIQCEIIIRKVVNDIVDSYGTPVFFFEVTDVNHPEISYIKSITVDHLTRSGMVRFPVPIGVYDVREKAVSRYTLVNAEKTPGGETVNATVTQRSGYVMRCTFQTGVTGGIADVTFENELTNYDYVSHNAIAVNIIPKSREITGISLEYTKIVPAEKNSTGYTISTADLVGYFIYDDGEKSNVPLTAAQIANLVFPDGLTVLNDAANANTVQILQAEYTLPNGRVLRTTFDVTIAPLETEPVQKVTFYVDGNNSCYFQKGSRRAFSNVVYYSGGAAVSGQYILPTLLQEDEEEEIRWANQALYGTVLAEADEASVIAYIEAHPTQTEFELYAKLGKLVVTFKPKDHPTEDDEGGYDLDDDEGRPPSPDDDDEIPEQDADYVQTFTAPADGYYYLETWGASGGDLLEGTNYANLQMSQHGGHGGYSYAIVYLTEGTKLYVHLGEKGMNASESGELYPNDDSAFDGALGGRNGGGDAGDNRTGSGGGMTHISLGVNPVKTTSGWNSDGLLVASGGGGGAGFGGSGGNAVSAANAQTANAHGFGGAASTAAEGGGGAGWYGGSSGVGGQGGSGYVAPAGTVTLGTQSARVITGNTFGGGEIVPTYEGAVLDQTTGTMIGNMGSGFARITFYENVVLLPYTGTVGTFVAPESGRYQLEAWGASGGHAVKPDVDNYNNKDVSTWDIIEGGRGGYASGTIYLNQGDVLYYAIGGEGGSFIDDDVTTLNSTGGVEPGGFNGGGAGAGRSYGNDTKSVVYSGAGGGATHFARALPNDLSEGVLENYATQRGDVLLVAGGGGGSGTSHNITNPGWCTYGAGGSGGGAEGQGNYNYYAEPGRRTVTYGGTQTTGGTFGPTSSSYTAVGKNGIFGKGGWGVNAGDDLNGGGGGWFGGAAGSRMGGSGGSGYVNTSLLSDGLNITGNVNTFTTKDGSTVVQPTEIPIYDGATGVQPGSKTMIGNQGNGFGRITYLG